MIWTRVEYTEPDMSDAGVFYCKAPLLKLFLKGNETGLESWVTGLEPREGELIIAKRYPSAFFATDLSTRLQLKGVDTLVICGVSTSGCVRASTLDAMCLGYRPIVGSGVHNCESRSPPCRLSMRLAGIVRKLYMTRICSIFRRKWRTWCPRARPLRSLRLGGYDRSVVIHPNHPDMSKCTRPCTLHLHMPRLKSSAILAEKQGVKYLLPVCATTADSCTMNGSLRTLLACLKQISCEPTLSTYCRSTILHPYPRLSRQSNTDRCLMRHRTCQV